MPSLNSFLSTSISIIWPSVCQHCQLWGMRQQGKPFTINIQDYTIFSLHLPLATDTQAQAQDEIRWDIRVPSLGLFISTSQMSGLGAICYWWTPLAWNILKSDSFDVHLTCFFRWLKASNVKQNDYSFCGRKSTQKSYMFNFICCESLPAI